MKRLGNSIGVRAVPSVGLAFGLLILASGTVGQSDAPDAASTDGTRAAEDPVAEAPGATRAEAENREEADRGERYRQIVRVGSEVVLKADEEASQVVVVFGEATVDGKVHGDVVVVWGKAKVNGLVQGDLVVPLGSLELGPEAHIKGDLVVVGGALKADPSAQVDGDRVELPWSKVEERVPFLGGVKSWVLKGLILGRPLPHQGGWWWWWALACAVVYLAAGVLFPRPIAASATALGAQPVGSFFAGVLGFMLLCVVFLLLAATGIGLLIVPFLFGAAFVAFVFGKVAVYQCVGLQLGRQVNLPLLSSPLVALALGIALFYVLYMIPVLGFLVWGLVAPLGFGAVWVATFRALKSERASHAPSDPPVLGLSASGAASPAADGTPLPPFLSHPARAGSGIDADHLPRAGFWLRFGATFLDLLLVGALLSLGGGMLAFLGVHGSVFLVVWAAYHVAMWAWKGTTIGGLVFGLKIVRRDGQPPDFAVALVRALSSFFSALALFLGFFWAGWTREKLAWHDLIAGTMVVKVPKGTPLL